MLGSEILSKLPDRPLEKAELLELLTELGIQTSTLEHQPLFTVADSTGVQEQLAGGHTKNLFLKDKKGQYFLLTAEQDTQVNLKTLHKLLGGSSRFSFGKPEALLELLGVIPGSVTAFGIVNDREGRVKFALDSRLMRHEIINCHPLSNEATTSIKREDLLVFAKITGHEAQIVDLAQEV
ncbi:MAG: hypothetical protein KTR25_17515 [Myxococcales bacterium]|nr:hypothetical protein [Myxococcales bacterium]